MQTFVGVFHLPDNKSLPYRHLSGMCDVAVHLCCELAQLTEVWACASHFLTPVQEPRAYTAWTDLVTNQTHVSPQLSPPSS